MNLYLHVPFCVKKCNYCAFYSICPDNIDWDGYVAGALRQMDEFHIDDYEMETIFFGGGTPSLMPVKHAEKIRRRLRLKDGAEWTLEANPKTLSSFDLKDWSDLGLNRLSIGIQSFDDSYLRFLGRIHSAVDSMELLSAANDLGLRVSGDFIYGLPNQSVADVARLCGRINDSGLRHASLYELTIERGTKFQDMDSIPEPIAAEMYLAIQSSLNLPRYEISNYGTPCRHNSNVWAGGEYIGVGESAAGRLIRNGEWIETKIAGGKIVSAPLSKRERSVEIVMTGLRTMRGVDINALPADVIDWDFVNRNPEYFSQNGGFLRMSDSGLLLLDSLICGVIS
jgi:oxygen-independent coproporphyrinogen-3 oxidase